MRNPKSQTGLTLVELMVAMVIGLILLAGISQVFLSNKQTYRLLEAQSHVQENGRFGFEFLAKKVREAGFQGCGSLDTITPNIIAKNPPAGGFSVDNALVGYEYSGTTWTPAYPGTPPSGVLANTDMISIRLGSDCSAHLVGNMTADNANIQLNPDNTCNFQAGDILIISDCQSTDIFRATTVSEGTAKITIAHAKSANGNTSNRLSKPYGDDAQIFKFEEIDFYIKNGVGSEPGLYSRINGTNEQELVTSIENLQAMYTIDDGAKVKYLDAGSVSDWSLTKAAQATITARSTEQNVVTDAAGTSADNRLRREFTSTMAIRNRLN